MNIAVNIEYSTPEPNILEIRFKRGDTLLHNVFYDIEGLPPAEVVELKKEAIAKFMAVFPEVPYRAILKGFAEVDPIMERLYKETFPRGGTRRNAGRRAKPPELKAKNTTIKLYSWEVDTVKNFIKSLRKNTKQEH